MGKKIMKTFLIIMACIFAVLTIVFYVSSIREVDYYAAKYIGTDKVANVQATVFCAACAILFAMNVIGAMILSFIENNSGSAQSVSSKSFGSGIKTSDGGVTPTSFWTCPKCKNRNPMSKIECRECGTLRQ